MPEENDVQTKTKRIVERSVRYPYYSLKDSIGFAETVKSIGGRREAPISSILKELNVTNTSNKRYSYLVSSAEQFGLIERMENALKVTNKVFGILFPTEGEAQKNALLKECFKKPNLYVAMINQYDGMDLPDKEILKNMFLHYGITENVVEKAVESFIDSAKYANVLKEKKLSVNSSEAIDVDSKRDDKQKSSEEAATLAVTADTPPPVTKPEPAISGLENYHKFEFLTSSGKKALIQIPKECTKCDLTKLKAILDVLCDERDV